jgi:hypothetical protein
MSDSKGEPKSTSSYSSVLEYAMCGFLFLGSLGIVGISCAACASHKIGGCYASSLQYCSVAEELLLAHGIAGR